MIQRIIQIPLEEIQTYKAGNTIGKNPCLICGKEIKTKSHKWVQLLTNGNIISTDQPIENSQGFFPVGNECAKKLTIQFSFKV